MSNEDHEHSNKELECEGLETTSPGPGPRSLHIQVHARVSQHVCASQ